jgi:hypothetical protein
MRPRYLTTRRRALQQLAASLGVNVIGLPTIAASCPAVVVGDPKLSAAVDSLVSHRISAAVIGEVYLARFDDERSPEVLLNRISKSLPADLQFVDDKVLVSRIQSDFDEGNFVKLHGWFLSRTEARLCALYAI